LLTGTPYAGFNRVATEVPATGQFFQVRNLVILSRFVMSPRQQIDHSADVAPSYRPVAAIPRPPQATTVVWERPLLAVRLDLGAGRSLHVICVHLKSKIPTDLNGQKIDQFTWRTASGFAEGAFISAMKRLGQALQLRMFVDTLFDQEPDALIAVCGDFNADADDVPLEAIRGDVENTGNGDLAPRLIVPCERTVPEPARYSLLHRGKGTMLDHVLVSRSLLTFYRTTQIHNEILHDKSIAFATNDKFPESDHAPVVAEFVLPD
jgi:predicted extracellular nuclease